MVTQNAINNSVKVTKYIANDTWTIDTRTAMVEIHVFGGGGGGGSGRRGLSTASAGGGGAGGGAYTYAKIPATLISSPVAITVGAAANGAPAQTVNNTDGSAGTAGNNSSFGTYLVAGGGGAGVAGSSVGSGPIFNGGSGLYIGGNGCDTSVTTPLPFW